MIYLMWKVVSLLFLPTTIFIVAAESLSSSPLGNNNNMIQRVVIVGGVHGNEYTGIWCVQALEKRPTLLQQKYDSLDITTLIGNPAAYLANRRYLDTDLNRQFTRDALLLRPVDDDPQKPTVEGQRALELNKLLGPKFGNDNNGHDNNNQKQVPVVDCIFDLHSTTSNMGMTLIVPEGDILMGQLCAYVLMKTQQQQRHDDALPTITRILWESRKSGRFEDPFLVSCAPHGCTLEVGPVPQGVLRHDAVLRTQRALYMALEFLHRYNTKPEQLKQELKEIYKDDLVPCYKYIAKIPWPSDPENPNFPAYIIHKNIQDQDYEAIINKGDPIFVDLDGKDIPYDGKYGSPICLIFINEGGYYYSSSGTGIGVAKPAHYNLETGRLVEETNKED